MPLPNEWAREALRYVEKAISFIESGEEGLSQRLHLRKLLERVNLYLDHHLETPEWHDNPNHSIFWNIKIEAERLTENRFSAEVNLNSLKCQRENLYKYLGETPPTNDPNQLTIDFNNNGKPENTI